MNEGKALPATGQGIGHQVSWREGRGLPVHLRQVGIGELNTEDLAADVAGSTRQPVAVGMAVAVDAALGIAKQLFRDAFDHQGSAQGAVPVAGGDSA